MEEPRLKHAVIEQKIALIVKVNKLLFLFYKTGLEPIDSIA